MKILYINTFDPYMKEFGGSVVTKKELELLRKYFEVDLLYSPPLPGRVLNNIFPFIKKYLATLSLKVSSYVSLERDTDFYKKYDLIWCNHDFSAIDYKKFQKLGKPFIIRKHNTEYKIIKKKFMLGLERFMLKRFESKLMAEASAVIHISPEELNEDSISKNKTHIYPPLYNNETYGNYEPKGRDIDLLCISNFNWAPNAEGIEWFLEKFFKGTDKLKLHLVGEGSEKYGAWQNVVTHGYVDDLSSLYKRAKFFIVPIISGAGIKIKLINAILNGVPVITTPEGMEGFEGLEKYVFVLSDSFQINDIVNTDELKLNTNIKKSFELISSSMSETSFIENVQRVISKALADKDANRAE